MKLDSERYTLVKQPLQVDISKTNEIQPKQDYQEGKVTPEALKKAVIQSLVFSILTPRQYEELQLVLTKIEESMPKGTAQAIDSTQTIMNVN